MRLVESANSDVAQSSPRVELIFDGGCPNVRAARESLHAALEQCGLPTSWTEYQHNDSACPEYACHCGSPAIFVYG